MTGDTALSKIPGCYILPGFRNGAVPIDSNAQSKAKPGLRPRKTFLRRFGLPVGAALVVTLIASGLYVLAHREGDTWATTYDRAIADCVRDRTRVINTAGTLGDPTSDCVRDTPAGR